MKNLGIIIILVALSLGLTAADVSPEDIDRLHQEAKQAFYAADYPSALAKWQIALNQAQITNKKADISKFIVNLGAVNYTLGHYQKALEYYQQAVIIDGELGDKSGQSAVLSNLGLIYYNLNQYKKAFKYHQQALEIQIDIDDKSGQSNSLVNLGMVSDSLGQYQEALAYYQQGFEIKTEISDNGGLANILSNMGVTYQNLSDYPKALAHFQQALEIQPESDDQSSIGNNLTNIGIIYSSLGKYPKALNYFQQALQIQSDIDDVRGTANNFSNLGVVYDKLGQYPTALSYYQRSLQIQHSIGDQRGIGNNFSNIGIVYKNFSNFPKALAYYQRAIKIQSNIGDRRGKANTLTNMGTVYDSLGQYPKALAHYLQALEIQRQLGDQQRIGNNLSNIGVLHYNLGQSEQALGYFLQALTIWHDIGDKRGQGVDISNLGAVYDSLGLHLKSLKYYQQALAIKRELGDKRGEGSDLSNIGGVCGNMRQYQPALAHFQQALMIDREIGDKLGEAADLSNIGMVYQSIAQYEKAHTALQASITIFEALGTHHLWYAQRGLAAVKVHLNDTKAAIIYYEQALDNIEKLRAGLTKKAHKFSFIQNKLYAYDEFITLLQRLHDKHPNKGYDGKALEIFERKQGRVFLEEIAKSGAQRFAHLPESITNKEQLVTQKLSQTKAKLVAARNKPIFEQDRAYIKTLIQSIASLETSLTALQAEIKAKYLAYYALKYPQPTTVAILQNQVLQAGELILVYNVMKDSTVLWIIGLRQFAMFALPAGEKELNEDVAFMREVILNRLPELVEEGYPLYQKLIPKPARQLLAEADTVYVVPTGPLYALPFETLVTQAIDYYKPHYLIQDHAIAYLSSASLLKILHDTQAQRTIEPSKQLLAFANPAYAPCQNSANSRTIARERGEGFIRTKAYRDAMRVICFPALPETANEAQLVAALFKASDNALYLGEHANRDAALKLNQIGKMDDYRYLLFAVHGLLSNKIKYLAQSTLVLSNKHTEGYLTMADAFMLELNADFINLSACNTGGGEQIKGEGIIGLTRAFMYAGTPAISVTLWSVETSSAKSMSIGIFENLKDGKKTAEALRQIKLKMIAGKANMPDYYRHPFYWAAFVVYSC